MEMNMTRIQRVALIAAAVALCEGGAAVLYAQGAGGRGPGGPSVFGRGGRSVGAALVLGQLDLSDAQKQQIRDITRTHRAGSEALVMRLQAAVEDRKSTRLNSSHRL